MSQETLSKALVSVTDGVATAGSPVLTSASAPFIAQMAGYSVTVANVAAGTQSAGNGHLTIAQKVLTTASNIFTAGMAGLWVKVPGAGTAGGDLITTIATFTNAGSVTLTDAAATSVTTAVITVYDGTLTTTILSVDSASQVTLAANATVANAAAAVTIAFAGSVDINTSAYPYVVFSSPLSGGDTVTVKVVLPDSMSAVVADDINGVRTGLSGTNPARIFFGGATYRLTKVGAGSTASIYADFGTKEVG